MRKITLTFPYYCQPAMLKEQLTRMVLTYSKDVKANMELIVVDDGSPRDPLEARRAPFPARFLRVDVDVPWNIPFVRNLAAMKAAHDWILFTDIDHLVPNDTMEALIKSDLLQPHIAYSFQRERIDTPLVHHRPHKNSVFIHKSLRDKIGGDDERLAGIYSGQELDFNTRIREIAEVVEIPKKLLLVTDNIIADSKVEGLPRSSKEQYEYRDKVIRERNAIPGWKPLVMTYPWHELK